LLRNNSGYANDLLLKDTYVTGIKEKCSWLALDDFDLFQNVAVDVLHDFLEGSCRYVMSFILTHIVNTVKLISLENLNSRIHYFNYGPDSTSKPCNAVAKEGRSIKLKCSASEMLSLVRYFGLIAGHYVPDENDVWLLYLKLRQLLDKLLSHRIYESTIEQVKFLVGELNELYCHLAETDLKPKFHFLTHYPEMLKKFGPLTQIWTMRFEAKHRVSKFVARASHNRINICKTIAIKHQLILNDFFLKNNPLATVTFGRKKRMSKADIANVRLNYRSQDISDYNCCYSLSWVNLYGVQFEFTSILVVDILETTCLPLFAKVQNIYLINEVTVIFYCILLKCIDFNQHYFAYQVRETNEYSFLSYNTLISPVPATLTVMSDNKLYVTVRWTID
jgi:hypothetical protein